MERVVFDRMAEHDDRHWWYVARRRILSSLLARYLPPAAERRILEIGCGTGHNFGMLGAFGEVEALEIDDRARAIAFARLGRPIFADPLPDLTAVPDARYGLIALLDVLEHVEDDRAALINIAPKLAIGGRMLITVPANRWMWSAHDVAHHHRRRYSASALRSVIERSGLSIVTMSHFNTLLFPPIVMARQLGRWLGREGGDDRMPSPPVNAALRAVFGFERHLIGRVPLPFGISLVAIVESGGA